MLVLIAANNPDLAEVWAAHLERSGAVVKVVTSQEQATQFLCDFAVNVIVLDLMLTGGSAIAVADFASYRQPEAKVVFVTNSSFFSDGSIFNHIPNACAYVKSQTPPEDLVAIVEHYSRN
jgi:CheY-like chemotaxis protein